jgi:hypothetical protein
VGGLLRVLAAVLAGLLAARLLRRSFRREDAPRGRRRRAGLDPSRAVRASWSEVEEERKEGPRDP